MNITAKSKICMVIGDPVGHSLSPAIFNAGFEKLGIDDQFVYVGSTVKPEQLEDFMKGVRVMNIRGISCTIPHKLEIIKYLDEVDEVAQKIGAANTIVNEDGVLKGYNSDWMGAVGPLERYLDLKGKKIALLGAGGAARAIAFGVNQKGAELVIFNRTKEKSGKIASEFGGRTSDKLDGIQTVDIIINATSVGMVPDVNESPINKDLITSKQIVFDVVYNPFETQLLRDAKEKGAKIIHGSEMFLAQAAFQFKLFTGLDAPEEVMRNALLTELKK